MGAWSDIYSLCATMYFMLTGIVPNEAIERMLQDTIVPLPKMSSVSLAQKQKNAIMKGICVKPEERWQSMLELYDALYYKKGENALNIKWFRKKQLKAALLLIFILLLCIGAGWKVKNRLFLCMAEMQLGLWLSQQP